MSPLLDEAAICATLSMPCDARSAEYTRTASSMAILDAFDRKLLREPAMDIFRAALELNERLREVEILYRVLWDLDNGKYKLDPPEAREPFEVVLKARMEQAESSRLSLLSMMTKVMECPWENDIIN